MYLFYILIMPAKKPIKSVQVSVSDSDTDSDTDFKVLESKTVTKNVESKPIVESKPVIETKPIVETKKVNTDRKSMILSSTSSDNDRIKLANAINNLTIKSDEFMNAMKSFDTFRESIFRLNIEIDAKKAEYNDMLTTLDNNYKNKLKELNNEFNEQEKEYKNKQNDMMKEQTSKFNDMTKTLTEKFQDLNRKLETEYTDKITLQQNSYKNNQIEIKQKLAEFKIKACSDFAKENDMVLIKQDELNIINMLKQKAQQDYEELKKSFDLQCNTIRKEELTKYNSQLKNEIAIIELTNKMNNADVKAQVEQQKREIEVLHSTINNLKNELVEQRTLTKEVAQASAKSQITQKFGKE